MTDQECAAVFHEMLDRLTFEGESLPVKVAIERAIELLESKPNPRSVTQAEHGVSNVGTVDPVHVLPHGSITEAPEALR